MDKLKSRKLGAMFLGIAITALNKKLGLGVSETEIIALCGMIGAYIASQGYVDSKVKKPE